MVKEHKTNEWKRDGGWQGSGEAGTVKKREATTTTKTHKIYIKSLDAWFGTKQALKNINLDIKYKTVTAFIGPSSCGKTTLIRCLNRMHEMISDGKAAGQVIIDGTNIYDRNIEDTWEK